MLGNLKLFTCFKARSLLCGKIAHLTKIFNIKINKEIYSLSALLQLICIRYAERRSVQKSIQEPVDGCLFAFSE